MKNKDNKASSRAYSEEKLSAVPVRQWETIGKEEEHVSVIRKRSLILPTQTGNREVMGEDT